MARAKKYTEKEIREDLMDQLERNGTYGKHYADLVEDYITMWRQKNKLEKDLEERGPMVDYISNTGQINKKKNESLDGLLKVNAQMLKLLDSLNIKASFSEAGMDDEM